MKIEIHNNGRKTYNFETGKMEYVLPNKIIEKRLSGISKNLISRLVWDNEKGVLKKAEEPVVSVIIKAKGSMFESIMGVTSSGLDIHAKATGYTEEEAFNMTLQKIMNQLSHRKGKKIPDIDGIKDKDLEDEYTSLMSQLDILDLKMSMQKNINPEKYARTTKRYVDNLYARKELMEQIEFKKKAVRQLEDERDAVKAVPLSSEENLLIGDRIEALCQIIANLDLEIASSTDAEEILRLRKEKQVNEEMQEGLRFMQSTDIVNYKLSLPRMSVDDLALLDSSIQELEQEIFELELRRKEKLASLDVTVSYSEVESSLLGGINSEIARAKQHLRVLLFIRYENANTVDETIRQLEAEIAMLTEQLENTVLSKKDQEYMDTVIDEEFEVVRLSKKFNE